MSQLEEQRMIRRSQLSILFIFLVALIFQQSCKTPGPSMTSPSFDATKSESGVQEAKPAESKSTQTEDGALAKLSPDSKPQELLPESIGGAPERELASPKLNYDTVLVARASAPTTHAGWLYRKDRQSRIVGFEFSNRGGNRILPHRYDISKNLLFTRDFQFRFDDRARQDIHLFVSDWAPSRDKQFRLSEIMNSVLLFFPRNNLPAIGSVGARYIVTLPTGEKVEFDAKTAEVLAGVFSETEVDLNPDRKARKFPGISYLGKGVTLRADARGVDPRIGNTATITTGTPAPDCQGDACNQCRVPSKELWHQGGPVRFKFSTDDEFDRYLLSRCGFGIAKNNSAITALPRQ
jgi:hypothetical protein